MHAKHHEVSKHSGSGEAEMVLTGLSTLSSSQRGLQGDWLAGCCAGACHLVTHARQCERGDHSRSNARGASTHSTDNVVSESKMPAGRLTSWLSCKYLSCDHACSTLCERGDSCEERRESRASTHRFANFVNESKMPAGRVARWVLSKLLSIGRASYTG